MNSFIEKYAIAVDLDGTLASYHGWKGQDNIGMPITKMVERCQKAFDSGKEIHIFTARLADEDDKKKYEIKKIIKEWCDKYLDKIKISSITCIKHKFFKEFWDDRAIQIIANTGMNIEENNLLKNKNINTSMDVHIGGNHYSNLTIQPAEYAEYNNIPALEAGVIKYVTRHNVKNGIEDIDKAIDLLHMIKDMRYSNNGKISLLNRIGK